MKTVVTLLLFGLVELAAEPVLGNAQEAGQARLRGEIVDADSGEPLAGRVYVSDDSGQWHFVESADPAGSAIRYEKRNWINPKAEEFHTTVSAHGFRAELSPGRYQLVVERGKEYRPATNEVTLAGDEVAVTVQLRRWIDMASRGWYSGDTHVHRTAGELSNLQRAEDLNVAFPLTYWVTRAFQAPASGDKNQQEEVPEGLVRIDDRHVFWPRNTEWEIFSIGNARHTLGAVFALGHREPFESGVPPLGEVAERAREEGLLLDLDKHDWPWSMVLPPVMGVQLYELANNHIWRTEFGFTNWSSATPEYAQPPLAERSGDERDWIRFTMENYYALLNCGLKMVPTAGTANGVHPVPLGFGRVYVQLPDGFSYPEWKEGLAAGRSFVTTGPMVFASVNRESPGHSFSVDAGGFEAAIRGRVVSEQPVVFIEVVHDGRPVRTFMGQNRSRSPGGFENEFACELKLDGSGWLAVRVWEERGEGRVRYAHTAPWHVEVAGRPLLPRKEERDYLVHRVQRELDRSGALLPAEAVREYEAALAYYADLPVREEGRSSQRREPRDLEEGKRWLEIMEAHSYSLREMKDVLGWPEAKLSEILIQLRRNGDGLRDGARDRLRVLPYPGGRHPRIGFLDGALAPQRETKFSVFTPWDPASYVVVDLPEAIWSNLGLTYLAHRHIDTIWEERGVDLAEREWVEKEDGSLVQERLLPNGIAFGAVVRPGKDAVTMELWLRNGTDERLTGLRVQNCVMLKGAAGFSAQSNWNKRLDKPFAAAHSADGRRWVITAWERCDRVWANPPVPCLHSDPVFPDLAPGETGRLQGRLWFYEGREIEEEMRRLREE